MGWAWPYGKHVGSAPDMPRFRHILEVPAVAASRRLVATINMRLACRNPGEGILAAKRYESGFVLRLGATPERWAEARAVVAAAEEYMMSMAADTGDADALRIAAVLCEVRKAVTAASGDASDEEPLSR